MRYVLKDKLISLGGDLSIKDDQGREVYFVDGKLISLGRRLEIKDRSGKVLAVIQQRLIALLPTFEIHLPEGVNVTISKRISLLTDRLKIDVPGPGDLDVHGDIFHHEYSIDRHGHEVARVSKRWISLVDAYGVEIDPGEDPLLILASAVVIDELLDERRERSEHEHNDD
jgi:uncharacterized protein YxjI